MTVAEIRDNLAEFGDPSTILANLFAFAPLALQVYRADGRCLMVNDAFRALFGSAPPPGYNVFHDEVAAEAGILGPIQRAFAGESVHLPPFWYDARDLRHVHVSEGRRAALEGNFVPLRDATGKVAFVLGLFRDRTEEMLAKERLESERTRAARIQETSTQGLMLFKAVRSAEGRIVDFEWVSANRAGAEMVGLDAGALVGKRLLEVMPGHADSGLFAAYCRVVETGEPYTQELHYAHDGVDAWFRQTVVRVEDGFASAFADITAEKKTVEDLRLQEERYRILNQATNDVIWDWDLRTNLVAWNEALRTRHGYAAEQIGADASWWAECIHPEDRGRVMQGIHAVIDGGESTWLSEYRFRRADGTYADILDRGYMMRDAAGKGYRMIGSMLDVSEKKEVERSFALLARASTSFSSSLDLATTLKNIAAAFLPDRADWCCVYLRQGDGSATLAACAHVQPEKEDWVRTIVERLPARAGQPYGYPYVLRTGRSQIIPEIDEAAQRALAGGDEELLGMLRDLRTVSSMTVPLTVHGQLLGAMSVVSATPSRRYTPADLRLAEEVGRRAAVAIENARLFEMAQEERRRVEEANRAKDEFLAVVSHELRTPLNAVLGWSRMLLTTPLDDEKRARAVATIERNARSQAQLIEDLLDISRIITGKLRLSVGPVNITQVAEAAIEIVRPAADAKEIRLEARLDREAGPLTGDQERIQQIVWNFLSNAVKFTPRGGRVSLRLERVASACVLTVEDTGKGIAPEFLPFVFERFRQAETGTTRSQGGLGLGLSIARHLAELHGGAVEATSEGLGKGSTFVLRLPIAPLRAKALSARPLAGAGGAGGAGGEGGEGNGEEAEGPFDGLRCPPGIRGLRILVVDDEPDARDLLASMLGLCGAEVITAETAAEAFARLRVARPDVLVSDIGMPGEDGYALIEKVRALSPEQGGRTAAVALTAYARTEDRTRALLAGFHMHVPKPIEPAEFLMVLANVAGRVARA